MHMHTVYTHARSLTQFFFSLFRSPAVTSLTSVTLPESVLFFFFLLGVGIAPEIARFENKSRHNAWIDDTAIIGHSSSSRVRVSCGDRVSMGVRVYVC